MKCFWFLITITFSFDLFNVIRRGNCYLNALDKARFVSNTVYIFSVKICIATSGFENFYSFIVEKLFVHTL